MSPSTCQKIPIVASFLYCWWVAWASCWVMGSKLIQIKWKLKTQWDLQKWNIAGRLSWAQCTMNACRVASFLLTDVKSYLKIEHNTIIAGRAWVWNSQPHCIAVIISSWSNSSIRMHTWCLEKPGLNWMVSASHSFILLLFSDAMSFIYEKWSEIISFGVYNIITI